MLPIRRLNFSESLLLFSLSIMLLISNNALSQKTPLTWIKKANGVWVAQAGKPEKINLLTVSSVSPKLIAINNMQDVIFPLEKNDIEAAVIDGKTYLKFPLDKGEKIFGLGLNFKTVEQRGRIMRLHVDHYGGQDNGRTHAPVPFYISSKGYGVFINSARYMDVWVGTAVRKNSRVAAVPGDRNTDKNWNASPYSDNVEILVPAAGAEIIVYGGPTSLEAVSRFNLYNGGGCLPPKWGLGFWHRTPTLYNDSDVLKEVADFKKHQFPLSVIGLEPGWQTKSYPCTYAWDTSRFPQPQAFLKELKNQGIKVNLWINPYISPDAPFVKKLLPYTASHTVWDGYVPDYGLKETSEIIGKHLKNTLLKIGVSGFKMDENDGYDNWLWPDVALFPSKIPAEQMRQTYGLMMQKMSTALYREQNTRTYGLVRSSNAGGTSFPYVLYNDYYSHRDFITALINSSFIGVLWTPEVRSSPTAEEWLRRMQTVCFSPLAMLNAWSDGTKPWSFPEVEKQVNEVASLRMALLPYLYTCFAEYSFYGRPPVRAMNLLDGFIIRDTMQSSRVNSVANPYAEASRKEMKDQFMLGDNLMVAPIFAGEKGRKIILPVGKWYNFYTGEFAGEEEIIEVRDSLGNIPVFVKDGGVIPLATPSQSTGKSDLIIRHYGEKSSSYKLYDDDGETYNYEKGEYSWRTIAITKDEQGTLTGNISLPEKDKPNTYGTITYKFMTK